jgi:hypothetical protein
MSIVDKIIATIAPPESEEDRAEATQKARAAAKAGDWLSLALDHHHAIRAAFAACKAATRAPERLEALRSLALVLNGHSLAEEVVLYPALAQAGEKVHAGHAYAEQTAAKMQMSELENIAPSSEAWLDKLGHIEGAVLHHIYEEESTWFLELKAKGEKQDHLTQRFQEEYERYTSR